MIILTYNIRGGLGIDNRRSLVRIADVIRTSRADIVCLQEVGRRWPRSRFKDQPKWLACHLGMHFAYQPNIQIGPAGFGNLILSKFPIIATRSYKLTSISEPRGLLEVVLSSSEGFLTVFCTHWGLSVEERLIQSKETTMWLARSSAPKLLCGDLNDIDTSQPVRSLVESSGMSDLVKMVGITELTYPSDSPKIRIDYVLGSEDVQVITAQVIDTTASDHRPVLVEITLPPNL